MDNLHQLLFFCYRGQSWALTILPGHMLGWSSPQTEEHVCPQGPVQAPASLDFLGLEAGWRGLGGPFQGASDDTHGLVHRLHLPLPTSGYTASLRLPRCHA